MPQPELRAYFLPDASGGGGGLVTWCRWCESLHHHGDAGQRGKPRNEQRGAHCEGEASHSPLTGYTLLVRGTIAHQRHAYPPAPYAVQRAPFYRALHRARESLSTPLFRIIAPVERSGFRHRIGAHELATVAGGERWELHCKPNGKDAGATIEGRGLLTLAAALWGITPGVAAVRVLEAVTRSRFDRATALAIEEAVNRWAAGGAHGRDER